MTQQPKWASIIAGLALLAIALVTLTPAAGSAAPIEKCRWCSDLLLLDFVLNVLLFVPLGLGTRVASGRGWQVVAACSTLSLAIELLQLTVVPGRDASILDWIANSLGGALGVWLATRAPRVLHPEPREARVLLSAAIALWLVMLIGGAWAMVPAPTSRTYYGQLVPELRRMARFEGELIAARVNGIALPDGRLVQGEPIRDGLRRGRIRIDAVIRPGPPPGGLAAVVRIADVAQQEILLLGQDREDLVFKLRLRATALRLRTPAIALHGAFSSDEPAPVSGQSMTAAAVLEHGRVTLSVGAGRMDAGRRATLELNPTLAWSVFVPWDYAFDRNARIWTALWIGGLLLPIGYWGAASVGDRSGRLFTGAVLSVVALSLAIVPAAFGLARLPWWQWFVAVFAIAIGSLAGRRVAATRHHPSQRQQSTRDRVLVG